MCVYSPVSDEGHIGIYRGRRETREVICPPGRCASAQSSGVNVKGKRRLQRGPTSGMHLTQTAPLSSILDTPGPTTRPFQRVATSKSRGKRRVPTEDRIKAFSYNIRVRYIYNYQNSL